MPHFKKLVLLLFAVSENLLDSF